MITLVKYLFNLMIVKLVVLQIAAQCSSSLTEKKQIDYLYYLMNYLIS